MDYVDIGQQLLRLTTGGVVNFCVELVGQWDVWQTQARVSYSVNASKANVPKTNSLMGAQMPYVYIVLGTHHWTWR